MQLLHLALATVLTLAPALARAAQKDAEPSPPVPSSAPEDGETEPAEPDEHPSEPGSMPDSKPPLVAEQARPAPPDEVTISRPRFGEEGGPPKPGWSLGFHGFARMPLRLNGNLRRPRAPRLIDNDYAGGFSYLRANEGEWAEIYLSAEKEGTRFVFGIFAGQFSDWSQTTVTGQPGIGLAFAEQSWKIGKEHEVGLRVGMFWDRYSYNNSYDTYMFARLHVAGARLKVRLWDTWYTQAGVGAHADLLASKQGLTPAAWVTTGLDLGKVDVAVFMAASGTADTGHEKAAIEEGFLQGVGAEVRVAVPDVGPFWAAASTYRLDKAKSVGTAIEVFHSNGGVGLVQNYFGPNTNGTGDITAGAVALTWEPYRIFGDAFRGLSANLFGMLAWASNVQTATGASAPDYDGRVSLKYGIEPIYRPPFKGWPNVFAAVRYDHVALRLGHPENAFDAITPRIGFSPIADTFFDIFVAYTVFSYGSAITIPQGKYPEDPNVTRPDKSAFKLQAHLGW